MARTRRSRQLALNNWHFRSQSVSWAILGQQRLFDDGLYRVRTRHSTTNHPNYIDSWDDIYPSALSDKFASK
jgi:hypothetical protein